MEINNVHVAYFSATYTTRTVVREIAARMGGNIVEHDITGPGGNVGPVALGEGDVMVAGVPVYAGRVPQAAAERLRRFSGNGVPAIAACVYGNRDYDDALLELADLLASGGFKVVGAGAFIGRHSIFTNVAAGRPDEADLAAAARLGEGCARLIAAAKDLSQLRPPAIKGNRPYNAAGKASLHPEADAAKCSRCGTCAALCPAGAIPQDDPLLTDASLCIACGRCLVVCPKGARGYYNNMYKAAAAKFEQMFSARKEAEIEVGVLS